MRWRVSNGLRALRIEFAASGWLLIGTSVAGVLSYAAVTLSARVLGTADFGLLGALLSVTALGSVLLRPANFAATHLAIAASSRSGDTAVRGLLSVAVLAALGLTAVLLLILFVFAVPLGGVLQTSDFGTLAPLAPLLAANAGVQLTTGVLSGTHRFSWLATTNVVDAAVRAIFIAPLVLAFGVLGSVLAYVAGQVAAIAFSIIRMGGLGWDVPRPRELADGMKMGASALSLLATVALLQQGDLILLRWYGPAEASGLYAACVSLGNLFVTLSAPFYLPSFPRALAAHRQGRATFPIFLTGLAPVAAASAVAIVGAVWLGAPVIRLLFGPSFEGAAAIAPIYLAKTAVLVLLGVIGQHAMAINRGRMVHLVLPPAVLGLSVVALLRPEPAGVAWIVLVCGLVLAAVLVVTTLLPRTDTRRDR